MNLIIAESLITMYGLPVDFMATYHFGWKMGEHLCKATGFILTTSGKTGILLPELFWPTVRKKNSSCQNIFLKLEAEGREFTNFLRSLEQFIQIVKDQNNFWLKNALLTRSWRFLISNKLEQQLEFILEKIIGI